MYFPKSEGEMENYARNADLRRIFKYLNFIPISKNVKSTLNIIKKIMVLIKLMGYFSILFFISTNKGYFLLTREKHILISYMNFFHFKKTNLRYFINFILPCVLKYIEFF